MLDRMTKVSILRLNAPVVKVKDCPISPVALASMRVKYSAKSFLLLRLTIAASDCMVLLSKMVTPAANGSKMHVARPAIIAKNKFDLCELTSFNKLQRQRGKETFFVINPTLIAILIQSGVCSVRPMYPWRTKQKMKRPAANNPRIRLMMLVMQATCVQSTALKPIILSRSQVEIRPIRY